MPLDLSFLHMLQSLREATGGFFTPFFGEVLELASSPICFFLIVLIYYSLDKRLGRSIVTSFGVAQLLGGFLNLLCCTPRPWIRDLSLVPAPEALAFSQGFSFPSCHSASMGALYGSIAWAERKHRLVAALSVVLLLLVLFSFNYLGIHAPQDVVVGALIGLFAIIIAENLLVWEDVMHGHDVYVLLSAICLAVLAMFFFKTRSYPWDVEAIAIQSQAFGGIGIFLGSWSGMMFEKHYAGFVIEQASGLRRLGRVLAGGSLFFVMRYLFFPLLSLCVPPEMASFGFNLLLWFFMAGLLPYGFTKWDASHPE